MKSVLKLATFATTAFAVIAVVPVASAQNLLANSGFETAPASATDWGLFGNAFWSNGSTNPTPHTGTGMIKEFGTFPGTSGAFQTFAATAGQTFTASGWGLNFSGDAMQAANAGFMRIAFFNAGNTEIAGSGANSNSITVTTPTNVWTLLSIPSVVAPVGTTHAQAFFLFTQPGTAGGSAWFDDANVSLVPEPVSLSVLGVGLVALVRRRRKSA